MAIERRNTTLVLHEADSFEECMAWVVKHLDTTFADTPSLAIHIDKSVVYKPLLEGDEGTPEEGVTWAVQIGGEVSFAPVPA